MRRTSTRAGRQNNNPWTAVCRSREKCPYGIVEGFNLMTCMGCIHLKLVSVDEVK